MYQQISEDKNTNNYSYTVPQVSELFELYDGWEIDYVSTNSGNVQPGKNITLNSSGGSLVYYFKQSAPTVPTPSASNISWNGFTVPVECVTDVTPDHGVQNINYIVGSAGTPSHTAGATTATVTLNKGDYITAYGNIYNVAHEANDATPITVTLSWNGTSWIPQRLTTSVKVKCTPTEVEPAAPTVNQLKTIMLVNVYCTVTEEHGNTNFGYVDDSLVSISAVKNGECTVTLKVQPYVDAFNRYNPGHQAEASVGETVTVPLKFNGYNWGIRQKGDEPEYAKVPVYCSETEVEPAAPKDNDLGELDGVRVRCTTNTDHKEKTYKIKPNAIVNRSEKVVNGEYTIWLNVQPYVDAYNSDYPNTGHTSAEITDTVQLVLEYDGATSKWQVKGGDLAAIEVKCDTTTKPSKPALNEGSPVLVQCVQAGAHTDSGKDSAKKYFALGGYAYRYEEVTKEGSNVWKDEADNKWTYQLKLKRDEFVKDYNDRSLVTTHTDTNPNEVTYVTWKHNGTKWNLVTVSGYPGIGAVINVTCKPKAPTADELKKLDMAVLVKCAVNAAQHTDAYDLLGKYNEGYFVGEPRKDGDDWLCDISYDPDLYVTEFNKASPNLKHVRNDEKIVPVTLIWDRGSWRIETQGLVHVTEEYTVTFDAYGGSPTPDEQHVKSGEKAVPPADPTRKGYTFAFWYLGKDEEKATEYNFDTPVTENITLTAKWEINKFKVTFATDGGEPIPGDQFVEWGLFVEEPTTEPTKTGYTFTGWYLGDKKYDFSDAVEQNITLTAKWELAEVDVNTYILPSNDDGMLIDDDALKPSTLERVGLPTAYTDKTEYESIHVGKFASKAAAEAAVAGEYDDYKDPDEEPLLTALAERETGFQLLTGIDREKFNKLNINWRWLHVAAGTDADPEHYLLGMLDFYWARFDENDGGDGTVENMPKNVYDLVYDYYLPGEIITMPDAPTREGYTFLGWEVMERPDRPIISSVSTFDAGTTDADADNSLLKPGDPYTIGTKDVMFVARWEKNLNVEITDISYDTWPRFLGDTFTVTAKADDAEAVVTLDYDLDGARPFELTDTKKNDDGSYTFTFKVVQITAANYNPRSNGEFFTATATKDNVTATDTDAKEINLRNRVHLTLLESGGTTGDETSVNDATVVIENIYMPGATQPMPYDDVNEEYRTRDWDISNGDDGKIIISVNGQTFELTTDVKGRDIRTVLKEGKEEVYATYTIQPYSFVGALMVNGTRASSYSGDRAFGKYGEAVNIEKLVTDAIARVKSDAVDGPNNPSKVEIKITRPGKAAANGEITAAQFGVGVTNNNDNDLTQPWLRPDSNLFRSEVWYNATTYYDVTFVDSVDTSTVYGVNKDVKWNTTTSALVNKPTKTGYTFVGWYKDAACENPFNFATEKIIKATTLYAKWTINQYTITFDTKGGSEIAPITQDYNTDVAAPANPTKTGYTFAGWDKDIPEKMPAENMTITAKWTINQYTITFDTKGGTAIAPITQDYGTAVTAPANPTKTGYTFAGWDKAVPTTMPAENMTITAQWTINYYPFVFDSQGGSEVRAQTIPYLGTAIEPADPTRAGYWFNGWYTDKTFKTKYNFSTPVTGPTTVYAGWTMIVLPSTIAKKTPKLNTADHFAYVQGYPDGTVKPAGNITRAETAAILFRLMDDTSRNNYYSTKSGFRDVAAGTWYNTYVATLNNAGVITDSANGYFRPNDAITRAELAAMLAAFTDTTRAANYFNDVTANYWAANAIAICAKLGWITGYPDGSFRPDRNVTRAELRAMINRATGRAPKSADAFLPGMKTWSDNTADKWYYLDVQEATNSHSYTVRPTEIWTAITAAPNWSKYE